MHLEYVPVSHLGAVALVVVSIFLFLAFVTVGLRIWSIRIVGRKYRLHDYLIFLSLFLCCCHITVIYLVTMLGGMGHHIQDVPPLSILTLLKLFLTANLTWLFSTTAVKASVLFFYLDVFKPQRTFRFTIYGFLIFVLVFFVAFLISVLTICQPISHLWDPKGLGFCGNTTTSQIATSSINTFVDLAIVLLPIPVVVKLQMSSTKKRRIIGVFLVGAVICMINLSRLIVTIMLPQTDLTYALVGPAILTCLEVEIGIINACLPTMNPIFTRARANISQGWKQMSTASAFGTHRENTQPGALDSHASRSKGWYPGTTDTKRSKGGASIVITSMNGKQANEMSTFGAKDIIVTRDVLVQSRSDRDDAESV